LIVLAVFPRLLQAQRADAQKDHRFAAEALRRLEEQNYDPVALRPALNDLYSIGEGLVDLRPVSNSDEFKRLTGVFVSSAELSAAWSAWQETGKPIRQSDWTLLLSAFNAQTDLGAA